MSCCNALTKKGTKCKKLGTYDGFCHLHREHEPEPYTEEKSEVFEYESVYYYEGTGFKKATNETHFLELLDQALNGRFIMLNFPTINSIDFKYEFFKFVFEYGHFIPSKDELLQRLSQPGEDWSRCIGTILRELNNKCSRLNFLEYIQLIQLIYKALLLYAGIQIKDAQTAGIRYPNDDLIKTIDAVRRGKAFVLNAKEDWKNHNLTIMRQKEVKKLEVVSTDVFKYVLQSYIQI